MATYARYNYTIGWEADKIGSEWHLVTREVTRRTPSGIHQYITINGVAVKARHCTVVQVFTK